MSAKTVIDEHETRVSVITAIAVDIGALGFDDTAQEVTYRDNPNADRLLYAKAFQAWVDGKIEGSAEDVFETVQEVLET